MINLKKIKNSIKGKKLLIADRGRIESVFKNYSVVKILEEKCNIQTTIVTQNDLNSDINILYRKLGFKYITKIGDRTDLLKKLTLFFRSLYEFIKCIKYFVSKDFFSFVYFFKVSKIHIGDLIYDRYIRINQNYLNPSFFDLTFIKFLFITIFKTLYLNFYLKKNKIELIIVNSHSYANNYSILFKLAKSLKIDLLFLKDFQITFFKKGQYSRENDPRILTKNTVLIALF